MSRFHVFNPFLSKVTMLVTPYLSKVVLFSFHMGRFRSFNPLSFKSNRAFNPLSFKSNRRQTQRHSIL